MNVRLFADSLLCLRHSLVFWYEVLNLSAFADQCSKPVAFDFGFESKISPHSCQRTSLFAVCFGIAVNSC